MKMVPLTFCVALLAASNLASAALTVTSSGFVDSATQLEWLAPSRVTSISDYNAYVGSGWRVATGIEIETILTNSYRQFDSSLFNAFAALSTVSQKDICTVLSDGVYCAFGWYHNVGTNGESFGYETLGIGLLSNPAQTDPLLVSQLGLDIGTFYVSPSTVGSSPLYGYGSGYDTFMVKAVPLPSTAWIYCSAIGALVTRKLKRRVA